MRGQTYQYKHTGMWTVIPTKRFLLYDTYEEDGNYVIFKEIKIFLNSLDHVSSGIGEIGKALFWELQ